MRVLLTGGSGFVGQHLIRRLRAQGHSVLALARSTNSAQLVTGAGADAVRGDLTELTCAAAPAWLGQLQAVDAVVHAAARMEFWGDDAGFRTDNYEPTVALHAAAARAGVARFVLISAASVSSGSQRAPLVDENTANGTPNIAYSRVKLATENALRRAATPGMTLVIVRPPFIWGAGMTTLTEMSAMAAKGRFVWIDGGRHIMDFVHVENLADAIGLALTRGHDGAAYYITDGTPMPIRDYLTALLATQGVDVSNARDIPRAVAAPTAALMDAAARLLRRRTPPPLTNWLITVMARDRAYDITAARTDLGYQPRVSLNGGLEEMGQQRHRVHAH